MAGGTAPDIRALATVPPPDPRVADWTRESRNPGRYEPGKELLATIRRYRALVGRKDSISIALRKVTVAQYRFWSAVCGADIPLDTDLGGGLLIPHPQGIVIHNEAVIGPNCLIMSNVTVGVTRAGGPPEIGGGVDIGTGAKILGPIRIGERAQIGANAVVVTDIPAGATAVGIPARFKTHHN